MRFLGSRLRLLVLVALLAGSVMSVYGQELLRADEYFDIIARDYAAIEHYTADLVWSDEDGIMRARLQYKRPNLIRVDFASPEGQWMISRGDEFLAYFPTYNVILRQNLRDSPVAVSTDAFTAEGLSILRRSFDISYLEGPDPVPIDEGSDLLVTKLKLEQSQATEGFRELILSIDESGFIRRYEGTMVNWQEVQMDLSNIDVDEFIPDARFDEELDAAASVYENFLFEPEG
jgi:outer membrane lipoprotein-sorting protein